MYGHDHMLTAAERFCSPLHPSSFLARGIFLDQNPWRQNPRRRESGEGESSYLRIPLRPSFLVQNFLIPLPSSSVLLLEDRRPIAIRPSLVYDGGRSKIG